MKMHKIKLVSGRIFLAGVEISYKHFRLLLDQKKVCALFVGLTGELHLDYGIVWTYIRPLIRSGIEMTMYFSEHDHDLIKILKPLPVNLRLPLWSA